MNDRALCWFDGEIVPARDARVSVFDHGLLYGDGVFEGLRFYHGKTFMLDAHLERLAASADGISLTLPYGLDQIAAAIESLIDSFHADHGYLRLVVTRGPGNLGIDPRKCPRACLFIIADQLSVMDIDDQNPGISLHVAQTPRTPIACLDPGIKSLNYLNNILARIEANRVGADEALMLNIDGYVCEGSVDNLFIVVDGALRTPPLSDGMLAGVTRAVIIDIAREQAIDCTECSLRIEDIEAADECFLTGTGAELVPVGRIGSRNLPTPTSPLLPLLMREFRHKISSACRD